MNKILIIISFFFLYVFAETQTGTFKDTRDQTVYKTIKIGDQTWMYENLKFKADGAVAYGNDTKNIATYGYLYDWETAKKACPKGWHLPNETEWNKLITFLGGKNRAGGKMKSNLANTHWKAPNRFAADSSKFNAFPSGVSKGGTFSSLESASYFWSSEAECTSAYSVYLSYNAGFADKKVLPKTDFAAIRCIKD